MKKVKELDWSKAKRGHFRGRTFTIIGDPRRRKNAPLSGQYVYRFTFHHDVQMDMPADNLKQARQRVLEHFNWTRMPRGVIIERLAEAA